MKRFLSIAILIVSSVALAFATTVSENEARARASAFFGTQVPQQSLARKAPAHKGKSGAAAYYVFNSPTDLPGWVIIAGDDRARTVLAWGDNAYFDEGDIPEGMQAWLDEYARQISEAVAGEESLPENYIPIAPAVANTRSRVAPMLSSLWGQGKPYSYRTPYVSGAHCPTGCTATAMAQILYFHKSAAGSKAIPAYQTTTLKIDRPALPATTFNYSKMGDAYATDADSLATLEVAKLMLYCGQSCEMNYNASSSGATLDRNTFVTYFGYDENAFNLDRRDVTQSEWEDIIYNEIVNGRPVAISAFKLSSGHAYVLDGYDNGLFHINWGWNGSKNGYFALNAMTDGNSGGTGAASGSEPYSRDLHAVIGLQPSTGTSTSGINNLLSCYGTITVGASSYTRTSTSANFTGVQVTGRYWNISRQAYTWDLGWALYNSSGAQVMTATVTTNYTLNPSYYTYPTASLAFGAGLPNGDYLLKPICRIAGTTAWTPLRGSGVNYVKARISGTTLTLEPVDNLSAQNLTVSSITTGTVKKVSRPLSLTAKVTNNGATDYNYIYLWENSTVKGVYTTDIPLGASGEVNMSYTPQSTGTQTIKLTADKEGTRTLATTTVTIAANTSATLTGTNTGTNTGTCISVKSVITNSLSSQYVNYIEARLWKVNDAGSGILDSSQAQGISLAAKGSTTLNFSFNNLEPGARYYVKVYYYSNTSLTMLGSSTPVYTIVSPYSKLDVNQDGAVNAGDVTAAYGTILGNTHRFDRYSDVNEDGSVNAGDVTAVYNAILGL